MKKTLLTLLDISLDKRLTWTTHVKNNLKYVQMSAEDQIFDNVPVPNFISWCMYEKKKIKIRKPTNR